MTEQPTENYEFRTVKCVRGLETRTCAKWEKEGWEVISQKQHTLQSEIHIRRPKPRTPWKIYAIVGGLVGVLIVTLIVTGTIRERSAGQAVTPAASISQIPAQPSDESSADQTESSPTPTAEAVITTKNNPEFKALLRIGDPCAQSVAASRRTTLGARSPLTPASVRWLRTVASRLVTTFFWLLEISARPNPEDRTSSSVTSLPPAISTTQGTSRTQSVSAPTCTSQPR